MTTPEPNHTVALSQHVTPLAPSNLRRVVAVLCVTETISYGILFYAFPVLASAMSKDTGWPLTGLIATFTVAQLIAAAAGIWIGRQLDRHGPRAIMTGGSTLAVLSIVVIAASPSLPVLVAGWALAGLAMSATFYMPAFTTLTHWAGTERVRALTAVTLVGGFASTVFAPLTAVLLSATDWRTTYLLLAAPLTATIPLHWWGLRDRWDTADHPVLSVSDAQTTHTAQTPQPDGPGRRHLLRQSDFVLLTVAFSIVGLCVYAVIVNLVPLMTRGGLSTTQAAVALGVGGAGQVAGRLLYAPMLAKLSVRARTIATFGAGSLTTLMLAIFAGAMVAACLASFAAGAARGIFTLLQATAITDRWGTTDYGLRTSVLMGSVLTASALAPSVGAMLAAATGSFTAAFEVLAAGAAVATALVRPNTAGRSRCSS